MGGMQRFPGECRRLSGECRNFWGNAEDFWGNAEISGGTQRTFGGMQKFRGERRGLAGGCRNFRGNAEDFWGNAELCGRLRGGGGVGDDSGTTSSLAIADTHSPVRRMRIGSIVAARHAGISTAPQPTTASAMIE